LNFKIEDSVLANYRSRYSGVHPLVFQRSLERANSPLELFEILESVPSKLPYSWDDSRRAWLPERDAMGLKHLESMVKK